MSHKLHRLLPLKIKLEAFLFHGLENNKENGKIEFDEENKLFKTLSSILYFYFDTSSDLLRLYGIIINVSSTQ